MKQIITSKTQGSGNDTFTVAADSENNEVFNIEKYVSVYVDKNLMESIKVTQGTFLNSIDNIDGANHPVAKMLGVYSYYRNTLVPCNDIVSPASLCGISELFYMTRMNGWDKYPIYDGEGLDKTSPKRSFAILNGNIPVIDQYNSQDDRQKLANVFYKGDLPLNNSKIVWFDPYGGNKISEYGMFIPDTILLQNNDNRAILCRADKIPIEPGASSYADFIKGITPNSNLLPDRTYQLFDGKKVASSSVIPEDIQYKNHIYLAIGMTQYSKHPYFVNSLKNSKYTTISQTPLSYFEEISAMRYTIIGLIKYHLNFYYNDVKVNDISTYVNSISPIGIDCDLWCAYTDLTRTVNNKKICDDVYAMETGGYPSFLPHKFNMKNGYTILKVTRNANNIMRKLWPAVWLGGGGWSSINGVSITEESDDAWFDVNEDGTINYNKINDRVAGITRHYGTDSNIIDVSFGSHDNVGPTRNEGVAAVDLSYITAENNWAHSLNYSPNGRIHDGYVVSTENSAYDIPTITVNVYIVDEE